MSDKTSPAAIERLNERAVKLANDTGLCCHHTYENPAEQVAKYWYIKTYYCFAKKKFQSVLCDYGSYPSAASDEAAAIKEYKAICKEFCKLADVVLDEEE